MGASHTARTGSCETFAHGSDVGVRGRGASPERAFEQAALALSSLVTDPACVTPLVAVDVQCRASSLEMLLVDFLNALIFEMATQRLVFACFEVQVTGNALTARAFGEHVDRERHEPAVEPKGATYTALEVRRQEDGAWLAQCVVDV